MRRAPTQEEFFRGSLSKNPINYSSLKASGSPASGNNKRSSGAGSSNDEPCVSDLRQYIAKDLQMEDSAELLELLVGNKILDMDLKVRVVQQVLWKKYVMENSTSASSLVSGAGAGHQMINTGSGLSMIFSSAGLTGRGRGGPGSDEPDVSQLPPMVVTYRLAGVDGEATEDKVEVGALEDPEAVVSSPGELERRMEKEFGITKVVTHSPGGVSVILASIEACVSEVTRRIRRDEIAIGRNRSSLSSTNVTRENFAKSPPCPGLVLLRHCANITDNRRMLLTARAPTILLRLLLDILNAMNTSPTRRLRSLTFDGTSNSLDVDEAEGVSDNTSSETSNPTTNALQELM
jgi:hypothetical protein